MLPQPAVVAVALSGRLPVAAAAAAAVAVAGDACVDGGDDLGHQHNGKKDKHYGNTPLWPRPSHIGCLNKDAHSDCGG